MLKVSREFRVGYMGTFVPGSGTTPTGKDAPYPWMRGSYPRVGRKPPSVVCGSSMWGVDPLADHDMDPRVFARQRFAFSSTECDQDFAARHFQHAPCVRKVCITRILYERETGEAEEFGDITVYAVSMQQACCES